MHTLIETRRSLQQQLADNREQALVLIQTLVQEYEVSFLEMSRLFQNLPMSVDKETDLQEFCTPRTTRRPSNQYSSILGGDNCD